MMQDRTNPAHFRVVKSFTSLRIPGRNGGSDSMSVGIMFALPNQAAWCSSILKDSSCCNRNPVSTILALILSVFPFPIFHIVTMRADKSFLPSYLTKIFSARLFAAKTFFKLKHRLRIVFHSPTIYI